jgi:hypothetical protein
MPLTETKNTEAPKREPGNGERKEGAETIPRQARLDAPGTLHHVIVRGLRREGLRISFGKGRSSVGDFHLCSLRDYPPEKE